MIHDGAGRHAAHFSYAPDFGRALALLGTLPEAMGEIWHIPSNAPITQAEFARLIGDAIWQACKIAHQWRFRAQVDWACLIRSCARCPKCSTNGKPFVMDDSKFQSLAHNPRPWSPRLKDDRPPGSVPIQQNEYQYYLSGNFDHWHFVLH